MILAQKSGKFIEMANYGSHDMSLRMWKRSFWYVATVIDRLRGRVKFMAVPQPKPFMAEKAQFT